MTEDKTKTLVEECDAVWAGLSDTGPTRDHNEDALGVVSLADVKKLRDAGEGVLSCRPPGALFMVSDGVGGASGGEIASRLAVRAVAENLGVLVDEENAERNPDRARLLERSIVLANGRVRQEASAREGLKGMAATFSGLWLLPGKAYIGQVGDSRIYRWRDGRLEQLTHDQSEVGRLVRSGKLTEREALDFPRKNVIDQAIGSKPEEFAPQTDWFETLPDDVFLLCSDGLVENWVTGDLAEQMENALSGGGSLGEACRGIVEASKESSGKDNITMLVVRVGSESAGEPNNATTGAGRRLPWRGLVVALAAALFTAALLYAIVMAPAEARHREELSEFEARLEAQREAVAGWRVTARSLEEDLDETSEHHERQRERAADLEAEISLLRQVNEEMAESLDSLRDEKDHLESDLGDRIREAHARLAESEAELNEAREVSDSLRINLETMEHEIEALAGRIEELEERNAIDETLIEALLADGESSALWEEVIRERHAPRVASEDAGAAWASQDERLNEIESSFPDEEGRVRVFRRIMGPSEYGGEDTGPD